MNSYLELLREVIKNKKIETINYVLENTSKENNVMEITITELSKITNTSRKTVGGALDILEKQNVIKREGKVIIVHPKYFENDKELS